MTDGTDRPLTVLVADSTPGDRARLSQELAGNPLVEAVHEVASIGAAKRQLARSPLVQSPYELDSAGAAKMTQSRDQPNVVFLDFFGFGEHESSDFIAAVRRKWPAVVFVLHADNRTFRAKVSFFEGARRRLQDYYRLARSQEGEELTRAVNRVLRQCLTDLDISFPADPAADAPGEDSPGCPSP